MDVWFYIFQVIALVCNTYIAHTHKERNVFIMTAAFNIFAGLTSLVQSDYGTFLSYLIINYRSIATVYKDKIKSKINWFPITFVSFHLIFGVLTYQNIWSIVPILTPIITGLVLWYFNNLQIFRVNGILNNFLWLIYNIHTQSYILSVTRIYSIVINILALIKNKKKGKRSVHGR